MPAPFKLLDCTFRDGGYYTAWDFPESLTIPYYQAVAALPIDAVEIGYRANPQKEYMGEFGYCPLHTLRLAKQELGGKKLAVMLNAKEHDASSVRRLIEPCAGVIDLVRFAVDPGKLHELLPLIQAVKDSGVDCAVNLMYLSKYRNDFEGLCRMLEELPELYCVSLVDSYGSMYPQEVAAAFRAAGQATPNPLGFHGHNNMELAFANSLAAIEAGAKWVDSTFAGMGRGAGNLKTELILTHLAASKPGEVDMDLVSQMVEKFEQLEEKYRWGTNLPYMVSGSLSLPQKDVMDWVVKRIYSINSIVRALRAEPEQPLPPYQSQGGVQKALIVGGGPSISEHLPSLLDWLRSDPEILLVHASARYAKYFQEIPNRQVFCLIGNEGHRMEDALSELDHGKIQCVLPPSPRLMGTYLPKRFQACSFELASSPFNHVDSCTAIALGVVAQENAPHTYLAGYDGYFHSTNPKDQDLFLENDQIFGFAASRGLQLASLTPTRYQNLVQKSLYELL